MEKNYNRTLIACYLGFITQAICANFAPLLFITFNKTYEISLGRIALIPTVFFFTQLIVDIICGLVVDKIGYRVCVVASEVCAALGLISLAFLPDLFSNPYIGILIAVIIYAIGSGLIEVLVSPIVEACPFEHKEAVMSMLHSFYCWGSVGVIVLSSLFFIFFGIENWKILACIWAIIPILNIFNFMTCPIERLTEEGKGMSYLQLFGVPIFWVCVILMICAGASELSMAQWASAYAESALGLSKTVCDLAGPCLFATTMGISRVIFGKFGDRLNLKNFMIGSGILCLFCYIMASVFESPVIGLIGCIMCGFSVGIMWPGSISISSKILPTGGTAMFALLAMAGDLGGSIGPALVGNITEMYGNNMHKGMLAECIFPVILVIFVFALKFKKENRE
ncbi:MAG: MFS transporter [Treponema sp.]|nr:MFS transporter [Treponema sp.]